MTIHPHPKLAEQLVHACIALRILLEYLGNSHLKVLLSHILPSLPQGVHTSYVSFIFRTTADRELLTSFSTDTPDFSTRAMAHLLGQRTEVDPSLE
jgi:hypothetical protein